jgi:hypothetical protein
MRGDEGDEGNEQLALVWEMGVGGSEIGKMGD